MEEQLHMVEDIQMLQEIRNPRLMWSKHHSLDQEPLKEQLEDQSHKIKDRLLLYKDQTLEEIFLVLEETRTNNKTSSLHLTLTAYKRHQLATNKCSIRTKTLPLKINSKDQAQVQVLLENHLKVKQTINNKKS